MLCKSCVKSGVKVVIFNFLTMQDLRGKLSSEPCPDEYQDCFRISFQVSY